jgi:hypothetical protein
MRPLSILGSGMRVRDYAAKVATTAYGFVSVRQRSLDTVSNKWALPSRAHRKRAVMIE